MAGVTDNRRRTMCRLLLNTSASSRLQNLRLYRTHKTDAIVDLLLTAQKICIIPFLTHGRGLTLSNLGLILFLTQQTRWIIKSIDVLAQGLVQVIRKGKYIFHLILIVTIQLEIFLIFAGPG